MLEGGNHALQVSAIGNLHGNGALGLAGVGHGTSAASHSEVADFSLVGRSLPSQVEGVLSLRNGMRAQPVLSANSNLIIAYVGTTTRRTIVAQVVHSAAIVSHYGNGIIGSATDKYQLHIVLANGLGYTAIIIQSVPNTLVMHTHSSIIGNREGSELRRLGVLSVQRIPIITSISGQSFHGNSIAPGQLASNLMAFHLQRNIANLDGFQSGISLIVVRDNIHGVHSALGINHLVANPAGSGSAADIHFSIADVNLAGNLLRKNNNLVACCDNCAIQIVLIIITGSSTQFFQLIILITIKL